MPDLNLTELDRLERRVRERDVNNFDPYSGFCLIGPDVLRPLLDLTEKMARALRGAGRDACLRFNDCPHDACIWRRSVLEEY